MYVRLRYRLLGGHVHVRVFVGKDVDHLQKSGDLVLREDEWPTFRDFVVGEKDWLEVDSDAIEDDR